MKIYILSLFFCLSCLATSAQNFYVMRIEGEVMANGKTLKKRDKVKQNSRLTFSGLDARVHLVSTKGNYNLTGNDVGANSQNEFLLELSNDYLASYSKSSSSSYLINAYENTPPPYYNYLLLPETQLPVPAKKNYILKSVTTDTTYRINLEEKNGTILLSPDLFNSVSDTSLIWKVFATDAENDSLSLYTFKNPEWEHPEKIVKNLKDRAVFHYFDWGFNNLRVEYLLTLFNQKKYLPDTLLHELIEQHIHWYNLQFTNIKTTIITPSEISYKDLENRPIDTHFYLAKLMDDTVSVRLLPRTNEGFYLTKSDFTSLDLLTIGENSRGFAIITSKEKIRHPAKANVLYFLQPSIFIELKDIKNDVKFLQKKLKLKDIKKVEEIQKDILMTEYDSKILWSDKIFQTIERNE